MPELYKIFIFLYKNPYENIFVAPPIMTCVIHLGLSWS